MLPLQVPKDRDNLFLCVNGIKYHWTEGLGVLWDDNYPHKVYNNTNETRIVLYMDVVRPFLPSTLHQLNSFLVYLMSKHDWTQQEKKKYRNYTHATKIELYQAITSHTSSNSLYYADNLFIRSFNVSASASAVFKSISPASILPLNTSMSL